MKAKNGEAINRYIPATPTKVMISPTSARTRLVLETASVAPPKMTSVYTQNATFAMTSILSLLLCRCRFGLGLGSWSGQLCGLPLEPGEKIDFHLFPA